MTYFKVGLSRQRMVIMALLLGCDYNLGGVNGVGREAVIKLFSVWGEPGHGELDRVLTWSHGDTQPCDMVASKPVHCATCGHMGSVATHRRHGCSMCGSSGEWGISFDFQLIYSLSTDSLRKLLAHWPT